MFKLKTKTVTLHLNSVECSLPQINDYLMNPYWIGGEWNVEFIITSYPIELAE